MKLRLPLTPEARLSLSASPIIYPLTHVGALGLSPCSELLAMSVFALHLGLMQTLDRWYAIIKTMDAQGPHPELIRVSGDCGV